MEKGRKLLLSLICDGGSFITFSILDCTVAAPREERGSEVEGGAFHPLKPARSLQTMPLSRKLVK